MSLHQQRFLVLDTETTGVNFTNDKVVEIAAIPVTGRHIGDGFDTLVNPGIPIPPTASAVHHLTDKDVADAPTIEALADRVAEIGLDTVIVAHNAPFDRSFLPQLANHRWLCTMRLAKHLFPLAPAYGNQVLRYWLKLAVPDTGLPPHRAKSDAVVTARLFRELLQSYINMHGDHGIDALLDFVAKPITIEKMPFGKYRDWKLSTIPNDYLRWVLTNCNDIDSDLRHSIKTIAG